jgi:hypothetical protein
MTSQKQMRANRHNAERSTGPKSNTGKKRSAQNARRHGLTGKLEFSELAEWLRVILDCPSTELDYHASDPVSRAALLLAEAEARLERVYAIESEVFEQMILQRTELDQIKLVADGKDQKCILQEMQLELAGSRFTSAVVATGTIARYLREAERQRHRALRHWIAVQKGISETNPFGEDPTSRSPE